MRILMRMATRNVYVSVDDAPLFDRATELAGSLSAAVAAGLKLFIAKQEREQGVGVMQQVEVEISDGPVIAVKQFIGRRILKFEDQNGPRSTTYRVYATAGGQFAVYRRDDPNWRAFSTADEQDPVWNDPQTWSTDWWQSGRRSLSVFPTSAAMVGELPAALIEAVEVAMSRPEVEELDI